MMKFEISKRLITTAILMALILALVIVLLISLFNEKGRILSALNLSQQNREQLLKTESVSESLLLAEVRFKEYCLTFEKPDLEEYKSEVNNLVENIRLLYQIASKDSTLEDTSISKIFEEKAKEADIYVRLKLITDSLMSSIESLEENPIATKKYIEPRSDSRIDTLNITETKDIHKRGLLGKIKNAIAGEKIQQNVNTTIRVQSSNEGNTSNPDLVRAVQTSGRSSNSSNISELLKNTRRLKESELKLINLNNNLIGEIRQLIDEIKSSKRMQEEAQNNSFLDSVRHSTYFLQSILIIVMVLACFLVGYILFLAYSNNKFQKHIISLNQKIMNETAQKDKFFSIISHDLMNPIHALLGFSEMLYEAVQNGKKEDFIEFSSIVNESAKRIFNLLQNLMIWSKIQNGKIKYTPTAVKINELVSDSMLILDPIARNKEISLQWSVDNDITATLDTMMISSVLQNLGTNAIKFTERGGSVTLRAFAESNNLNFIISDTGVGMTEEQLNKLFRLDKTYSSMGTNDEAGTGLGLIICKEFIESNKGKVWVESTLGKGSDFCFSIPLS